MSETAGGPVEKAGGPVEKAGGTSKRAGGAAGGAAKKAGGAAGGAAKKAGGSAKKAGRSRGEPDRAAEKAAGGRPNDNTGVALDRSGNKASDAAAAEAVDGPENEAADESTDVISLTLREDINLTGSVGKKQTFDESAFLSADEPVFHVTLHGDVFLSEIAFNSLCGVLKRSLLFSTKVRNSFLSGSSSGTAEDLVVHSVSCKWLYGVLKENSSGFSNCNFIEWNRLSLFAKLSIRM